MSGEDLPYHYLCGYMKDGPSGRVPGLGGGDLLRAGQADKARMGRFSPIESSGINAEDVREVRRPGEASRGPRMLAVWLLQLSLSKLDLVCLLAHSMTSAALLLLGAAAADPAGLGGPPGLNLPDGAWRKVVGGDPSSVPASTTSCLDRVLPPKE